VSVCDCSARTWRSTFRAVPRISIFSAVAGLTQSCCVMPTWSTGFPGQLYFPGCELEGWTPLLNFQPLPRVHFTFSAPRGQLCPSGPGFWPLVVFCNNRTAKFITKLQASESVVFSRVWVRGLNPTVKFSTPPPGAFYVFSPHGVNYALLVQVSDH